MYCVPCTSKIGAVSKAQKAQNTFFVKKIEFFEFFSEKMSHSAEKCKRGDPLGFINKYSVAKHQKTRKGDSFEKLKSFRKKSHNAETKIEWGTLLSRPVFVGYIKKVKNERGTLSH